MNGEQWLKHVFETGEFGGLSEDEFIDNLAIHLGKKIRRLTGNKFRSTWPHSPKSREALESEMENLRYERERANEDAVSVRVQMRQKLVKECDYILSHEKWVLPAIEKTLRENHDSRELVLDPLATVFTEPHFISTPSFSVNSKAKKIFWIGVTIPWILKHRKKPLLGSRRFALFIALRGE